MSKDTESDQRMRQQRALQAIISKCNYIHIYIYIYALSLSLLPLFPQSL
jgi:hypothetical protein